MMLTMMEASEVRKNFAEVTHRIEYGNERVIIAKRGKPAAAMISVEDLQKLERIEDEIDARIARERIAELDAGTAETVTFEEALAELGLK
jgi:prevent-host-death family protein